MNEPGRRRLMRSAVLPGPGEDLTIDEIQVPEPAESQVLLRVSVATVCARTDLNIMAGVHPPHDSGVQGMLPHDLRVHLASDRDGPLRRLYPSRIYRQPPFPASMGHEAAGTVVALGPNANAPDALVFSDQPLAVGDRVATFRVPTGYSDYACLPSHNVVKLPDFMNDDEGSLLEPIVPNYNCLRRCWSIAPSQSVLILGQGFQGLVATQVVRALGAELVIVSEPLPGKRRLALQHGADVALDPGAVRLTDEVERLTGSNGVDLVVECVGTEEAVQALPYLVRRGGMIAQIGGVETPVLFDYGYLHFKHILVVPSYYVPNLRSVAGEVSEILALLEGGRLQLRNLVTHRFDLADLASAFRLLVAQPEDVVKVAIDVGAPTRGVDEG